MKPERLEALGRVYERMRKIIDYDSPLNECDSKHSVDAFISKYKDEEKLGDLHDFLRWHRMELDEIYYLAKGDEE